MTGGGVKYTEVTSLMKVEPECAELVHYWLKACRDFLLNVWEVRRSSMTECVCMKINIEL